MTGARGHFVAEIITESGARVARDPWRPDAPVIPIEGIEADGFVEVRVDGERARPVPEGFQAHAGSALASLVAVAVEHGLDPVYPPAVLDETEALAAAPGIDDPALVDLTHLAFLTIDNEDSRDLDQALHIERDGAGHRVRYAIADAAHFIRPGTALFDEALARGASFYFPGWSVPMLPRPLSEGLVSLNPKVARRAQVFDMRLDETGACVDTRMVRARIESHAKLSYDGVQAFLDAPEGHPYAGSELAESLRLLVEVGERRIALAAARDVVQHRRHSVEIGLGDRRSFVIYAGLRNDVERYNEQLSLLCNVEGARLLRDSGAGYVQPIYKVHPAPPPERVRALESTVERLVRLHGVSDARWRWRRGEGQSLASYLRGLPGDGPHARLTRAIERQAILANVRSSFSSEEGKHHGVGADIYARFSAPMREIVGVFLHKELAEHLAGGSARTPDADEALRAQIVEAANRAKSVQSRIESLAHRMALDALFERDLAERPVRRGTVLGLTHSKLYLTLDDPPLEVKVYRRDLEDALGAELVLGRGELTLERKDGTVVTRIGAALDVVVERRDADRDRWVLRPA